ncbi:hypothetical protein V5799_012906 [Amblyomma americanum]|uniref:Secreted protein n=1 Tax=Amblyomma americanum TaxID=6943 RepID=A0AAQ4E7C4_AMBAM
MLLRCLFVVVAMVTAVCTHGAGLIVPHLGEARFSATLDSLPALKRDDCFSFLSGNGPGGDSGSWLTSSCTACSLCADVQAPVTSSLPPGIKFGHWSPSAR